jgi:hypothetical protein
MTGVSENLMKGIFVLHIRRFSEAVHTHSKHASTYPKRQEIAIGVKAGPMAKYRARSLALGIEAVGPHFR